MEKIIGMYIDKTKGRPICYYINRWKVTSNPKVATEYVDYIMLDRRLNTTLYDIYNGDDSGNMTEHECYHIREDYFKGIEKKDVIISITTKDNEILYMRKLKIQKLYENTRVL